MNSQPGTNARNAETDAGAEMATHLVLINHEEQYCLWPAPKAVPNGWSKVFEGSHDACLAHVEETWTDMRPKSVRD